VHEWCELRETFFFLRYCTYFVIYDSLIQLFIANCCVGSTFFFIFFAHYLVLRVIMCGSQIARGERTLQYDELREIYFEGNAIDFPNYEDLMKWCV
jgi:hypothetical protein